MQGFIIQNLKLFSYFPPFFSASRDCPQSLAYGSIALTCFHCHIFCYMTLTVSVCSGYYNKILQTGWLINSRNLFLTVLEVGTVKVKALPSWLIHAVFSSWPYMMEKARDSFGNAFIRALILLMSAPHSWSKQFQRP